MDVTELVSRLIGAGLVAATTEALGPGIVGGATCETVLGNIVVYYNGFNLSREADGWTVRISRGWRRMEDLEESVSDLEEAYRLIVREYQDVL